MPITRLPLDDVLTVKEATKLLKIGRNTLYDAIGRNEVPHQRIAHAATHSGVPVGNWRSVGHSINAFTVESAIDELDRADILRPEVQLRARAVFTPQSAQADLAKLAEAQRTASEGQAAAAASHEPGASKPSTPRIGTKPASASAAGCSRTPVTSTRARCSNGAAS